MISRPPLLVLLAWQTALLVNIGAPADPEHLRFERAVELPSAILSNSPACAVLDATVLAHSAVAGGGDLRLYRGSAGSHVQAEVPYLLTQSGPEPVDAVSLRPAAIVRSAGALQFDLRMPPRAYSELRLRLTSIPAPGNLTHDFIGTVLVTAPNLTFGKGSAKSASLGNFGIFDLSHAGLGRWTTLLLAENTAPVLHLTLTLRTPAGQAIQNVPSTLVVSVDVPPSRERQTVYTPVASSASFSQQGNAMVATLHVPAHVPIESLHIAVQPGPHPNFARDVVLTARSNDDPFNEPETLDAGLLEEVRLPAGDPRLHSIDVEETNFPSTLGATLASSASVQVAVANDVRQPLPLLSATLEMRERRLCFIAIPEATYTLRYGDPALVAPFYPDAPQVPVSALSAVLGPQVRNPHWTKRRDTRPFFDRHPELFWIIVLACTGMMGGTALQFVQHRAEGARR